jgi:hypothetical protein
VISAIRSANLGALFPIVIRERETISMNRLSSLILISILVISTLVLLLNTSESRGADPYDALYHVVMAGPDTDGKIYGLDSSLPLIWPAC